MQRPQKKCKVNGFFVYNSPQNAFASHHRLIQILLKSRKYLAYLLWSPEIGNGVRNGVEILEAEERRQLLLVEFVYPDTHIVS